MMLRHLGLDYHANAISNAVYKVIKDHKVRTPDMGGTSHTVRLVSALREMMLTEDRNEQTDFTFAVTRALGR